MHKNLPFSYRGSEGIGSNTALKTRPSGKVLIRRYNTQKKLMRDSKQVFDLILQKNLKVSRNTSSQNFTLHLCSENKTKKTPHGLNITGGRKIYRKLWSLVPSHYWGMRTPVEQAKSEMLDCIYPMPPSSSGLVVSANVRKRSLWWGPQCK